VLEVKVSHDCDVATSNPSHSWIVIDTGKSPLEDEGAWRILFQYLTTEMTYPQMEEEFISYLGNRYCANDWKDARCDNLVFFGLILALLTYLYILYICGLYKHVSLSPVPV
jgi:hypothetical protein